MPPFLWIPLLAALGLLPTSCAGSAEPGSARGWYEVVVRAPGVEVTDPSMRQKIRASGRPWKVRDRATGIEMVLIMPGEFLMGSPEDEVGRDPDEGPQHRVRLTQPFYLGATELTQAQWRRVMGEARGFFKGDDKPADGSFDDLQEFLAKANAGKPSAVPPLRPPTEAEWEYAARAGTTGSHSFGGPASHALLNFNDGVPERAQVTGGSLQVTWRVRPSPGYRNGTAAAGSLPANPWGLHEMHGNVWEWTADRYSAAGYGDRGPLRVDPWKRPIGREPLSIRGGDWYRGAAESRSASRNPGGPHVRSNRIGFRVARSLSR